MKSVLLIDDSSVQRTVLKSYFQKYFPSVAISFGTDGQSLVRLYEEHTPDLTVIDLHMPYISGDEAAMDLLSVYPDAQIIISSAADSPEDFDRISRAMLHGVAGYLIKPFGYREFIETIAEL
ncbi:response regulator transcription factor [Chitinivibrio alkaliphilus]|uniref:Chemotaxis protein CheY n=1 Tax=Chitinivibrio alkaliphilus ACht1 TaxID=1313304 RepID=U7D8U8_9BACT|nr:response regulator transcription factor [Chitinivibrio alkaliphilus]ERP31527.1 chemotaxis protein CheY [Chitinivibrio alkaliphilus ACht1]